MYLYDSERDEGLQKDCIKVQLEEAAA